VAVKYPTQIIMNRNQSLLEARRSFASFSLIQVLAAIVVAGCAPRYGQPSPTSATRTEITASDTRSRIFLVAHDSMRGREAGSPGNFTMTSYIAREMTRLGLEPGGENGSWYQTIPMIRRSTDSTSSLITRGQQLRVFSDFALIRPSATAQFALSLPPGTYGTIYGGRAGDSSVTLNAADVNGRILILDAPLGTNGQPTSTYATAGTAALARYPGAAAIMISVIDLMSTTAASGLRNSGPGLAQPVTSRHTPFGILISSSAVERIMGAPAAHLKVGAKGADVTASVRFTEAPVTTPARNVIAIIRGSDPALRGEYVAIGAHSDHIAPARQAVDHDSLRAWNRVMRPNGADMRVAGSSTPTQQQTAEIRNLIDSLRKVRPPRRDSIFNGADDDGSGSVALLEIAESLAHGKSPRRSILLVWHTAEEAGLLGSAWFAAHPTVPHDSIIAQLNMDMVGRGTASDTKTGGPRNLQVIGSRRLSTDLGDVVDSVNAARAVPYIIDYTFDAPRHVQNRYCRSDHYMYARTGIPISYFSRGYHPDYHMVTDEPQYIDYGGLASVAGFLRDVALSLANRNDRVRVDKPKPDPLAPCQQ
jgi:hypothetical protein